MASEIRTLVHAYSAVRFASTLTKKAVSAKASSAPTIEPTKRVADHGEAVESYVTYERVASLLADAPHKETRHAPTKTSQESADIRGETLASGAKAMLLSWTTKRSKSAEAPRRGLCVLSAAKRLDLEALQRLLTERGGEEVTKPKLASPETVLEVTGCVPGGVPPFGSLFGVETLLDPSLLEQGEVMNFNAGHRGISFRMRIEDYLLVEKPIVMRFSM